MSAVSGRRVDPAVDEDRLHRVAVAHLTEPGDPRVSGLVDDLGAAVVHDGLLRGLDLEGLGVDAAARVGALEPERALEQAHRAGLRFVVPGDSEWPVRLDDLVRAAPVGRHGGRPLGLWVRGPLGLDELDASVALVGARAATTYGTDTTARLAVGAADAGWTVVSGAAYVLSTVELLQPSIRCRTRSLAEHKRFRSGTRASARMRGGAR